MEDFIDYTDHITGCVKAHGKGNNVLILYKTEQRIKRFDGKFASYEIVHRWLTCVCKNENDGAYCCVKGSDTTYWTKKEVKEMLSKESLFDAVQLF